MSRDIIIVKGVFSKVVITLNDDVINRLAIIEPAKNPLKGIETKLRKNLKQFEKEYTKIVSEL